MHTSVATTTETMIATVAPNATATVTQTVMSTTTVAKKVVTTRVTTTDTVVLAMELSTLHTYNIKRSVV